jgi:CRP-like cAMP-binding protein
MILVISEKDRSLKGIMASNMQTGKTSDLAGLTKASHSLKEKIDMIETTKWANEFSWDQLKVLAAYMDAYEIEQGRIILQQGRHDAHMILIIKGEVNLVKDGIDQDQKLLTAVGPGKIFGEMSLIDGEPRSASAIAATHVTLLVLSKDKFVRLTKESPYLGVTLVLKLAKLMSQRLRQTTGRLIAYL